MLQDLQPQLRVTVAEVAELMQRVEEDRVTVVQPKAEAVAADKAAAQAQASLVMVVSQGNYCAVINSLQGDLSSGHQEQCHLEAEIEAVGTTLSSLSCRTRCVLYLLRVRQADVARGIKEECEAELAVALPILQDALAALDTIKEPDVAYMRKLGNPPAAIKLVLEARPALLVP